MIFDERTIYLFHTVRASGEELYEGFEWSEATNAILQGTNNQEIVEHIVRRMNSQEARKAYYGRKERQTIVKA